MKHFLLLALAVGLLLCAQPGIAQAPPPNMRSPSYALDWTATGAVSGGEMASSSYRMSATVGQMAANTRSASPSYQLASGFQSFEPGYRVYCPIVFANLIDP